MKWITQLKFYFRACIWNISKNFNYFENLKLSPIFIFQAAGGNFLLNRAALWKVSSFFLSFFFACSSVLATRMIECHVSLLTNVVESVWTKRRHRRGRPCTCCFEYPSVQVGFSWASPLATTVPTIPVSRKMGDEITFLFSKFLLLCV